MMGMNDNYDCEFSDRCETLKLYEERMIEVVTVSPGKRVEHYVDNPCGIFCEAKEKQRRFSLPANHEILGES